MEQKTIQQMQDLMNNLKIMFEAKFSVDSITDVVPFEKGLQATLLTYENEVREISEQVVHTVFDGKARVSTLWATIFLLDYILKICEEEDEDLDPRTTRLVVARQLFHSLGEAQ